MAKFPTMDEFAKDVAEKAIDEWKYQGRTIREWIQMILSGDYVPEVHGKWLDVFAGFNFFAATCSVCHKRSDLPPIAVAKYCPRCGARMDGEHNENS